MTLKLKLTFIFSISSFLTFGQSPMLVSQPTLPSPEQDFRTIFQKEKLDNPIFLNGPVKEVQKNISFFNLSEKEKQKDVFFYSLNRQKKVTSYTSNIEFDEMNPSWLNMQELPDIKVDTTLYIGEFKYTIKNEKVIARESNPGELNDLGFYIDSTSFLYEDDILSQIVHYSRYVHEEIDNENDTDNSNLLFSDYYLLGYEKAWYDNKGQINFKQEAFTRENLILVNETQYQFNRNGEFECFARTQAEFEIGDFDMEKHFTITTKNILENDRFHLRMNTTTGVFKYDNKDRCKSHVIHRNKKESFSVKIEYNKDKMSIDISNEGSLIGTQEFKFDAEGNPIKVDYFDVEEEKKTRTQSIKLDISYFK